MALNPEISLGVRVPQINLDIPSPIQQFGQMMSLKGLMEQQQLRRAQIAQEEMQLDALRRANAGQEEFRRRMTAGEDLTPGQTLGILGPKAGVDFLKGQQEVADKDLERRSKIYTRMYQLLGSATDAPTYSRAVMQAAGEGLITPDEGRRYLSEGYDRRRVGQMLSWTMSGKEQADLALSQARAEREAQESAARLAKERAEVRLKGLEEASLTVPDDPAAWAAWRARLPAEIQPLIPPQHSPAGYQLVRQYGVKPKLAEPGVDVPLSPPVFEQKKELAAAASGAAAAAVRSGDAALVETVRRNPSLFDNLSPEVKSRLAPQLEATGFKDFGTKLSDTELNKIQETQKGIDSLTTLRQKIKNNPGAVGPVSGWLTHYPWATQRKKLQADIDTARQMIGKALEGGVLRKEDEEKYARILPTMTDAPDIADYKLEQLDEMMRRDLGTYKASLRSAGRRIDTQENRGGSGVPQVGDTFNGGKVKSVTRIE
jgi:hypothetical protein